MRLSQNNIKLSTNGKSKMLNSSYNNQDSDDLLEIQTVVNLEETGNKSSIRKVADNTKCYSNNKPIKKKVSIVDKLANRKLNMSLVRDKENRNSNSTTLREKNDKNSDLKNKFNSCGNYFSLDEQRGKNKKDEKPKLKVKVQELLSGNRGDKIKQNALRNQYDNYKKMYNLNEILDSSTRGDGPPSSDTENYVNRGIWPTKYSRQRAPSHENVSSKSKSRSTNQNRSQFNYKTKENSSNNDDSRTLSNEIKREMALMKAKQKNVPYHKNKKYANRLSLNLENTILSRPSIIDSRKSRSKSRGQEKSRSQKKNSIKSRQLNNSSSKKQSSTQIGRLTNGSNSLNNNDVLVTDETDQKIFKTNPSISKNKEPKRFVTLNSQESNSRSPKHRKSVNRSQRILQEKSHSNSSKTRKTALQFNYCH